MMRGSLIKVSLAVGLPMAAATAAAAGFPRFPVRGCRPDAVAAGTICLDKYEASVWRVPSPTTTNANLVTRIHLGRAARDDLIAGGATQLGTASDDYAPCTKNGQNCANDIFAVSLPAEMPSAFVTWFQAQEACANSGKRLPTSTEWQVGANGTPDPGPDDHATTCNSDGDGVSLTGSRRGCVSARGTFDMVGNLAEWVADWVPASTFCPGWANFSDDQMCLSGASTTANFPGALLRGGWFFGREIAGPFAVTEFPPFRSTSFVGFRCGR
jgi:formylglycine-generating enzyme required for sulfatase activity